MWSESDWEIILEKLQHEKEKDDETESDWKVDDHKKQKHEAGWVCMITLSNRVVV